MPTDTSKALNGTDCENIDTGHKDGPVANTFSKVVDPEAPTNRRNDIRPDLIFVEIPPGDLKAAPTRVRETKKKQLAKIKRSIQAYGWVVPVLITGDNQIVNGHSQVAAATELGLETISCIQIDHLSDTEIRALSIALNKTQETGTWDELALKLEFASLLEFGVDLEITGFEAPEIDMVLEIGAPVDEGADPVDDIGVLPNADATAVTRPGDLWALNDHRILCGNARDAGDISRLLDGAAVAMAFTDPPYNVRVNGHARAKTGKFDEFAEASGELSPAEFAEFLSETLGNTVSTLEPGGLVYVFMDRRHMAELKAVLEKLGLQLINLCVWAKPNGGMGSLYRSRHELVFVAKVPGAPHRNNVELGKHGRNRSNVWEYAGASGGRAGQGDDFSLHPTVKPIRLIVDAILDVTALGETMLDPFLGSGSTLLAAERTRRRCLGLEISPAYVDVAIRRWQEMTGQDAVHAETGQTFNEREAKLARGDRPPDPPPGPGQYKATTDPETSTMEDF